MVKKKGEKSGKREINDRKKRKRKIRVGRVGWKEDNRNQRKD